MPDQPAAPLLKLDNTTSAIKKTYKEHAHLIPSLSMSIYSQYPKAKSAVVDIGLLDTQTLHKKTKYGTIISPYANIDYETSSDCSSTLVLTPTSSQISDWYGSPITESSVSLEDKDGHAFISPRLSVLSLIDYHADVQEECLGTTEDTNHHDLMYKSKKKKPVIHQFLPLEPAPSPNISTLPSPDEAITINHRSHLPHRPSRISSPKSDDPNDQQCEKKTVVIPWQLHRWLAAREYEDITAAERMIQSEFLYAENWV
jgi:hypothetical protein